MLDEDLARVCRVTVKRLNEQVKRNRPHAFTEHGAVMLASVLNSTVAERAGMRVVRALVELRSVLASHRELAHRLDELERKSDRRFGVVFDAIGKLLVTPRNGRLIGFRPARSSSASGLPRGLLAVAAGPRRPAR